MASIYSTTQNFRGSVRSSRSISFDRIGTDIRRADSLESALALSPLGFEVEKRKVFCRQYDGSVHEVISGAVILRKPDEPGQKGYELGFCGPDFTLVQNQTSFEICQLFAGAGAKWDRAGSYDNGARNWVRMEITDKRILDDVIKGYVIASNSHLPGESFRVQAWEEKLVCKNGMTALVGGAMLINMRHTGQVRRDNLLAKVNSIMCAVETRLHELERIAESTRVIHLTEKRWEGLVVDLLPYPDEATDRQKRSVDEKRSVLYASIKAPDLANHVNYTNGLMIANGWAALNAVSDFTSHLNDSTKTVRPDRMAPRLLELSEKDQMLTQARDLILAMN